MSKWYRIPFAVGFVVFGIAILMGWLFPQIPSETGLRFMLGLIVIMMGIYRFVSGGAYSNRERRY